MQGQCNEFIECSMGPARLRVIADGSANITTVVEAEKRVARAFADRNLWRHETVTLFILENLAPLLGQLRQLHGLNDHQTAQLPQKPMVNIYDLKNPRECFIFVNLQIMRSEGYWNDALAIEGLLAHEHAHPLGECPATMAARPLKVTAEAPLTVTPLLVQLGEVLSVGAISELFSNDMCLSNGFDAALVHLDRKTIDRAEENLGQRPELQRRLAAARAAGTLLSPQDQLLIFLADAQTTLPFVLELSPFFRTGRAALAAEIENTLRGRLLPQLEAGIAEMVFSLHELFLRPRPNWDVHQVKPWCREVLAMLSAAFSRCGPHVVLHLSDDDSRLTP